MKQNRSRSTKLLTALTLALLAGTPALTRAADHMEAPGTQADPAADIADVYAWHDAGRLVTAITFAGLRAPVAGQDGTYDEDVLYEVRIGRDGGTFPTTYEADVKIGIRFAQENGNWTVTASNVPGTTGDVTGAVGTVIDDQNVQLYAGLRDDPFFFDLEGFNNTLATGTLMFDSTRDSVAGLNCTAIVLEMDLSSAAGGGSNLYIWATTSRKDS
ncbi:MAG: DUF4331 family protein [Gemmatimonadetes bacterium]|nr:DUF4331 family protein [Gemmatimonadota bacterium]